MPLRPERPELGATKKPAPLGSGPGCCNKRVRLPGRSREADEIKNGGRVLWRKLHICIIMHLGAFVKRARLLDSDPRRALACVQHPDFATTFVWLGWIRLVLLNLVLLVVVLSLLLTVLIGEPGVRGVPKRAA